MQLWKCYQTKQAMAKAKANSNGKQKYGLLVFGLNKRSVQCYKSHATWIEISYLCVCVGRLLVTHAAMHRQIDSAAVAAAAVTDHLVANGDNFHFDCLPYIRNNGTLSCHTQQWYNRILHCISLRCVPSCCHYYVLSVLLRLYRIIGIIQ